MFLNMSQRYFRGGLGNPDRYSKYSLLEVIWDSVQASFSINHAWSTMGTKVDHLVALRSLGTVKN